MSDIETIAKQILSKGKGILAADESTGTMTKRLEAVNIPSTEQSRLLFRKTLFSSESMKSCIGGVILYDETIKNADTIAPLKDKGIVLGIKVDKGAKPYDDNGGKLTEGLDGLPDRLKEYGKLGAEFAKWRAVININDSGSCILANAWNLARYAKK